METGILVNLRFLAATAPRADAVILGKRLANFCSTWWLNSSACAQLHVAKAT